MMATGLDHSYDQEVEEKCEENFIKYGKEEWKPMGEEILTLAVLSILITAPLGAVCILGMINISSHNFTPHIPQI